MKKYTFTALVLVLSAISGFINAPCQAQTVTEEKAEANNKISATDKKDERSPVNNTDNPKSTVVSENTGNTTAVSDKKPNTQPTFRIPIGCRIFAAPSMEQ